MNLDVFFFLLQGGLWVRMEPLKNVEAWAFLVNRFDLKTH